MRGEFGERRAHEHVLHGLQHRATDLESSRTASVYQGRLHAGLLLFLSWFQRRFHTSFDSVVSDCPLDKIDQLVCDFIEDSHKQKKTFWLIKHGLLGIQTRWRGLRGHLPRSWDSIGV